MVTRALIVLALLCAPTWARAQDVTPKITTAVLIPSHVAGELDDFSASVERLLRKEIDALDDVDTSATPAFDLAGLQLAVGCVAENDDCLRDVAAQLGVKVLVASQINQSGSELMVSLLKFDAGVNGKKRVVRRASGGARENELLEQIGPMVDELYGRPIRVILPGGGVATVAPAERPLWPLFIAGGGGVLLLTGLIVGGVSNATEANYAEAPTNTAAEVDAALVLRGRAETQSSISNVLLVAGVAIGMAGGVMFFAFPGEESPQVEPVVQVETGASSGLRLGARGRFGGHTW